MRSVLLFLLLAINYNIDCQTDTIGKVRFSPEFRFTDGIFLDFSQVKENAPIPKPRILTELDYNDEQFFNQLLEARKIFFFDNLGGKKEVETKKLWGFSRNGNLYVRVGGEFYRITVVGSICHFVANVSTYNQRYSDPFQYDRYYYPYGAYNYPPSNYESKEMRQFILDFSTGNVYDYEVKNMEVILMRDPVLHDEYMALSKKKKKQLKFMYIRKFNERNPLYLPLGIN
ncbi:MAG: hypothetical protein U0T82_10565 [Bacteroidales bacterium]